MITNGQGAAFDAERAVGPRAAARCCSATATRPRSARWTRASSSTSTACADPDALALLDRLRRRRHRRRRSSWRRPTSASSTCYVVGCSRDATEPRPDHGDRVRRGRAPRPRGGACARRCTSSPPPARARRSCTARSDVVRARDPARLPRRAGSPGTRRSGWSRRTARWRRCSTGRALGTPALRRPAAATPCWPRRSTVRAAPTCRRWTGGDLHGHVVGAPRTPTGSTCSSHLQPSRRRRRRGQGARARAGGRDDVLRPDRRARRAPAARPRRPRWSRVGARPGRLGAGAPDRRGRRSGSAARRGSTAPARDAPRRRAVPALPRARPPRRRRRCSTRERSMMLRFAYNTNGLPPPARRRAGPARRRRLRRRRADPRRRTTSTRSRRTWPPAPSALRAPARRARPRRRRRDRRALPARPARQARADAGHRRRRRTGRAGWPSCAAAATSPPMLGARRCRSGPACPSPASTAARPGTGSSTGCGPSSTHAAERGVRPARSSPSPGCWSSDCDDWARARRGRARVCAGARHRPLPRRRARASPTTPCARSRRTSARSRRGHAPRRARAPALRRGRHGPAGRARRADARSATTGW